MNDEDISLALLRGRPVDVKIGKLHPLTLKEIDDMGEIKYYQYVSIFLLDKNNLQIEATSEDLTSFKIFLIFCYQDEIYREMVLEALKLFFKEEPFYHPEGFLFFGDLREQRILDEQVFELIKNVIKKQNYLKEEKEEELIFANDKAREIYEKVKQAKEKIRQMNKDDGLRLNDIISIVASYSLNINLFNVWDLTVYQLYEMYIRLIMKDTYESQFAMLLQGADSKELKLEHWARKTSLESI